MDDTRSTDDKLRSLFADFNPELSSDRRFIDRLERNLHSVEIVKRQAAEERSRNRKAMVLAAVAGFVVGVLFSMALPQLTAILAEWLLTLPGGYVVKVDAGYISIFAWIAVGAASVAAALNTYDISLSLLKSSRRRD